MSNQSVKARNSNIELLRIVGMVLIVWNHYLGKDLVDWGSIPLRSFSVFFSRLGGVGDTLFFGITAYYLCAQENKTLRQSAKRIWKLEKQLLFYGWLLFVLACLVQVAGHSPISWGEELAALAVRSLFPASQNLWWYPTAYIIVLLLLPALDRFLRSLGKGHVWLAFFLFVAIAINPPTQLRLGYTFLLFIYQYIIISALRWHFPDFFSRSSLWKWLLAIGLIVGVAHTILSCAIKPYSYGYYFNGPWYFPSLFIGLGLICMQLQRQARRSRIVNFIAAGTFAPYLILTYPWCRKIAAWLVQTDSVLGWRGYQRVLLRMATAVGFFVLAVLFDTLRRALFRVVGQLYVDSPLSGFVSRVLGSIQAALAVFTLEGSNSMQRDADTAASMEPESSSEYTAAKC